MSDIFISYAKEDRVWAESLAQRLRKRGWSVFWDRTIPTGKTWRGVVGKELEDAHCVIVLWSDASISSDWVHEEADDGRQRGILLPAFKENVIPPIGFRHIQAEDLTNWDNKEDSLAFLGLIDDIRALLASPVHERRAAVMATESISIANSGHVQQNIKQSRRLLITILAVAMGSIAIAAAGIVSYWKFWPAWAPAQLSLPAKTDANKPLLSPIPQSNPSITTIGPPVEKMTSPPASTAPLEATSRPARIIVLRNAETANAYALCDLGRQRAAALAKQFLGQGATQSLFARGEEPAAFIALTARRNT